jgi:hypothetical protein
VTDFEYAIFLRGSELVPFIGLRAKREETKSGNLKRGVGVGGGGC